MEGKDENSLDSVVLEEFLNDKKINIKVKPLGPSFHIHSVAEALYKHHPNYYFLIDRDYHTDEFVENSWSNFPDPSKKNLLVWRRREIENYFLDPEFLILSEHCSISEEQLRNEILGRFQERIYIDAANQVIVEIREDFKENWIQKFKRLEDFQSRDDAIEKLTTASEFPNYKNKVTKKLDVREIEKRFDDIFELLSGSKEILEFGCGKWLELQSGKEIVNSIVNSYFAIEDARGNKLQGINKRREILKDLMRKPLNQAPNDFRELHNLLLKRIQS